MTDETLDCRGMHCPMPIVAITKAVKGMASGGRLEVQATDLAFKMDLEAWARRTGNTIENFQDGDVQTAVIIVR